MQFHRIPPTGVLRRIVAFALPALLALSACDDKPGEGFHPLRGLNLAARGPSGGGGGGSVARTSNTDVIYFDAAGQPMAVPSGVTPQGEGYTLNLQGVPVEVAARSILADVLQAPYALDPGASGTITMATGGPVPRGQLLAIFEEALKANGLLLIRQGDAYLIRPGDATTVTANMSAQGYGLTALPLKAIGARRMLALLDGFALPAGAIRAAPSDDMLLVRGSQSDRAAIAEIVSTLDVGLMARPNAGIAFLKNARADAVEGDLARLQSNDPRAAGWKTQVLERSNAILVQARDRADLARAMQWIARLDRSGGNAGGGDVAVYRVQYARAAQLVALLQATFGGDAGGGGGGGSAAAPAAEPNAEGGGEGDVFATPAGAAPTVQGVSGGGGGGDVRFTADEGDNTIVIRAPNPIREQALSLLRSLDKAPVQVLIDVMLVEVALNDATRMGVQAYLQGNEGSLLATPGQSGQIGAVVPGFNLILGNMVNPKLIINALSQVTDVRVVSAPSVSAFENEEAEIKVVDQVPIVTQQVVGTQTPDAPVVNSVQYTDAGVIMRVTPQIASTGLVNLKISQELSAVAGSSDASGSLTPTLRRRSISTRVAVYDQQTVALGGLISTQASKGLTANKILPILGRHQSRDGNRSELVVFITPHVVRNERDASAVSQELRNKMTMMDGQ